MSFSGHHRFFCGFVLSRSKFYYLLKHSKNIWEKGKGENRVSPEPDLLHPGSRVKVVSLVSVVSSGVNGTRFDRPPTALLTRDMTN